MTTASSRTDASPLLLYRRNRASGEVSWSGSADAALGPFPSDSPFRDMPLTAAAWLDRTHPEDRPAVRDSFAADSPARRLEYRLACGPAVWRLVADDQADLDAESPGVAFGALRRAGSDVETEAKPPDWDFVRFFELSLDLFCIANLTGYFLRVNGNFTRLLGYSESEFLSRPFLDFVHPEDVPATVAETAKLMSGGMVVQFRNRYRDRQGDYHWLEWMARPIPEDDIIFAVARDVTDARLAEAQRIARVGSWEWRVGSDSVWWSDEQYRILGFERGRVVPSFRTFLDRVHPADRDKLLARIHNTVYEDGNKHQFDFRILLPDGAERIIWTDGRVEKDASGNPYRLLGTCQDITERRREQEERQALERKMQEAQKLESLGLLAGGIAHDFNNLLTAILGNASWIESLLSADSAMKPSVDQIVRASERAAEMCRQMLAYSGRGRFVLSIVDLNQLVREMAGLVRMSLSKKAELRLELADGPLHLCADATQIRQVVMNLLINASEAIGDQEGTIRVVSGLRQTDAELAGSLSRGQALKPGEYVVLEVVDSGVGMGADTLRKIFDPFFTTKFTGRGLGLAAVLGIVRGHKGAIDVTSEVGRGATFRLLLPHVEEGALDVTEAPPALLTPPPPRGEGAVLVVEDEDGVREVIARLVDSLGYDVIEARDGMEALEQMRRFGASIQAVLLDLTMPKLDGEETLRKLHEIRQDVPVVLMSGFSEHEIGGRFADLRLAGFLPKPFTLETLADRLRVAIEARSVDRRIRERPEAQG
jgi:PAS domain S-box-containing protein